MKRIFCYILCAVLLLTATACAKKDANEPTEKTNIVTLNGTTGFGMAKLMDDLKSDESITFSVESDASVVTSKLISGEADIACLPTNAASTVYNKTKNDYNKSVSVLCINTKGCLFVVSTKEGALTTLADLEGKTVFAPAQNPTFILSYLCKQANVDLTVDNTYAIASDLKDAVAAGRVEYAVLPEPMVTVAIVAAKKAGVSLFNVLDLTAEWNKLEGKEGTLVQGCLVVRNAYLDAHPDFIRTFLSQYEAALDWTVDNPAEAGELIVQYGVFTNAGVAANAIPKCNIAYLDREEMKAAMVAYLSALSETAPASIGGALPGDNFYYAAK